MSRTAPTVAVPLDERKTPQQNAAYNYKLYNKAKTANRMLTELIAGANEDEAYLESVLDELSRAECDRDLADIRRELVNAGYIKEKTQGQAAEAARSAKAAAVRIRQRHGDPCRPRQRAERRAHAPYRPPHRSLAACAEAPRKPCDRVAGGGRGERGNDPAGCGARCNVFAGENRR